MSRRTRTKPRRRVERARRGFEPVERDVGCVCVLDDDADGVAPSERHEHARARRRIDAVRRVVEQSIERNGEGDANDGLHDDGLVTIGLMTLDFIEKRLAS